MGIYHPDYLYGKKWTLYRTQTGVWGFGFTKNTYGWGFQIGPWYWGREYR